MDQRVTDNNDQSRFEVFDGDELAGLRRVPPLRQ